MDKTIEEAKSYTHCEKKEAMPKLASAFGIASFLSLQDGVSSNLDYDTPSANSVFGVF